LNVKEIRVPQLVHRGCETDSFGFNVSQSFIVLGLNKTGIFNQDKKKEICKEHIAVNLYPIFGAEVTTCRSVK
jgi:hypothetical protein